VIISPEDALVAKDEREAEQAIELGTFGCMGTVWGVDVHESGHWRGGAEGESTCGTE
jgi:hypothetical protein